MSRVTLSKKRKFSFLGEMRMGKYESRPSIYLFIHLFITPLQFPKWFSMWNWGLVPLLILCPGIQSKVSKRSPGELFHTDLPVVRPYWFLKTFWSLLPLLLNPTTSLVGPSCSTVVKKVTTTKERGRLVDWRREKLGTTKRGKTAISLGSNMSYVNLLGLIHREFVSTQYIGVTRS